MNALIKKQYAQVKELVARIKLELAYYHAIDKTETEQRDRSITSQVKMMELFALLTGNADIIGDIIIGSDKIFGKTEEVFAEYEKSLLEDNLIEYGDTLSESQKLHYYHQQQQEQEYYRNEF